MAGVRLSASEYVREILRRHQAEESRARIDAQLTGAIASGTSTRMTSRDWKRIRREGMKLAKRRAGK
jgi:Arc/MetJ-type ribon-helix-helix transcriptional regulator